MFPNPKDTPPRPAQSLIHQPVAGLVAREFEMPVCTVAFGFGAMPWAIVPETTVRENGKFEFLENEIWLPQHLLVSPPALDAMLSE